MNAISAQAVDQGPAAVMAPRRLLRAYLTEAKYESVRMVRSLGFSLPFLLLPVLLYLLFAVVMFGDAVSKDPFAGGFIFVAFAVFGMMGPGLFAFGAVIATEREQGLLTLKRALPAPSGSYLLAKMLMAVVFGVIVMATMVPAALWLGHLQLSPGRWLLVSVTTIVGALPFCAIGLFIGVRATGKAALAYVNFIYVPMMHISGLFYPLPKFLKTIAPLWPTYHLQHLVLRAFGLPVAGRAIVHAAVLIGMTLLLGGLSVRRLSRRG